ncbi:MAG: hypothetical protein JNL48_17705 [Acidobacteria bacterium]|nr:hypothetical protein [Acidobacteriota bacterium]
MIRRTLFTLAATLAAAVLHTWPLASDPAGLSRHDNADTTLTTWTVSWVARALTHDPLHVFDAPIFHPEKRTLAYSEPLIVPGTLAIPLRAAGLDATVTYNLLVILGLALSAAVMWRLVAGWTSDEAAGAVAGLAYAFNAHLLTRFGHIQALHAECFPVVLYAIDRLAARATLRDGVTLGLGLALVGLTSIYQLAFAAGATVAGILARVGEWRRRPVATAVATGAGITLGVALLAPMLWQYLTVNRQYGLARTVAETADYAATWRDYLATGGRLHYAWWSAPFFQDTAALFPGVTVALLGLAGCFAPREQQGRVRMMAAIGVTGVLMSLGPVVPGYTWLFEHIPLLQATRATDRWGVLALTALAVLAAYGLALMRTRTRGATRHVITAVAIALVTLEALRAPMAFRPTPAVPAIYARIAALPGAVLLEYPTYEGPAFSRNAPYLLAQTEHWKPIVAGYSGTFTPDYTARLADLATFPAERARQRLREMGITHVVLHLAPLRATVGQAAIDAVDQVPWVTREFEDDTARVYRVRTDVP